MIKNIPSPCCGEYSVLLSAEKDGNAIWYSPSCPKCGLTTRDKYDNKQEAIYEYEKMCIETWKRNKNGLLDWMKKKPETKEEADRRIKISEDVMPYLLGKQKIE